MYQVAFIGNDGYFDVKFVENDVLLNYDITDYCYKLNFILSDKNKPFTETLSLW